MIPLSAFPAINAALNAASGVFLTVGYIFIKRKKIRAHKVCMVSALVLSTLFLSCYLYYHYHHGSTPFLGQGVVRLAYFSILIPHVVLAIFVLPMALITVYFALKGNFFRHVKIARKTLPIWLYVSITGVIVYLMLYQL